MVPALKLILTSKLDALANYETVVFIPAFEARKETSLSEEHIPRLGEKKISLSNHDYIAQELHSSW